MAGAGRVTILHRHSMEGVSFREGAFTQPHETLALLEQYARRSRLLLYDQLPCCCRGEPWCDIVSANGGVATYAVAGVFKTFKPVACGCSSMPAKPKKPFLRVRARVFLAAFRGVPAPPPPPSLTRHAPARSSRSAAK